MKLTHLIKQIQNDLVDSQWKSYRHSQDLYWHRKETDFLPTPVAKDLDVELTLHFAIENQNVQNPSVILDHELWIEGLQKLVYSWFLTSLDRYDTKIGNENSKIDGLTQVNTLSTIKALQSHADNLFNESYELNAQLFIKLLKEKYREYILQVFPNRIIIDKSEDGMILEHFEELIRKKLHTIEGLINSCLSPTIKEDIDIIIDASALKRLPPEAIHTAKLNIKVQDIEDQYDATE